VYPENPPRVRLEWLIATARAAIAIGAFITLVIIPFGRHNLSVLDGVLSWYVLYSLAVLAMVWAPVKFAAGWDLAVHVVDIISLSLLSFLSVGAMSPVYVYFTFLFICGTLRWHTRGAFWTAVSAISAYTMMYFYVAFVLELPTPEWRTFANRSVPLAAVAGLIGCMAAYQRRYQNEISRLVAWPRKIPPEAHALVAEVLAESAEILNAQRVLLVWEEPGEGYLNLASQSGSQVVWTHEPEATYGSVVIPGLEGKNFQVNDATDDRGTVVHWSGGSYRQRRGRPINAALQRRFEMRAVQSWSLDGELVRGRLFCLDKSNMRLDDLPFGVLVARMAVSRLDGLYLLKHLRDASAIEERLRLARDLHDSLLQTVAGSALQLLAARRLLDRDSASARKRLEDVQNQLERGELDMRTFISRLRPSSLSNAVGAGLTSRLEELCSRVERQWEIKVKLQVLEGADNWPDTLANEVYRIVQEGVLNAARHADASAIGVVVAAGEGGLQLEIVDDGRGFPFRGTYDLNALNEMNRGPLTLKERVAELRGDLRLKSLETGSELSIRLPFAKVTT
jgi:signal transduction histidine kinase